MKAQYDITGQKFGRLTAVRFVSFRVFSNGKRQRIWEFRCDCGKTTVVLVPNVKSGHTSSCGCLGDENRSKRIALNTKHGHARKGKPDHLYIVWLGMKQRCEDTGYKHFDRWGGRGIKVLWESYQDFDCDMRPTFKPGLTIERKDNNGHYCKENCKWATYREQALNTRRARLITFNGETKNLSVWAEELGFLRCTLAERLKRGWTVEQTLTTPLLS